MIHPGLQKGRRVRLDAMALRMRMIVGKKKRWSIGVLQCWVSQGITPQLHYSTELRRRQELLMRSQFRILREENLGHENLVARELARRNLLVVLNVLSRID